MATYKIFIQGFSDIVTVEGHSLETNAVTTIIKDAKGSAVAVMPNEKLMIAIEAGAANPKLSD